MTKGDRAILRRIKWLLAQKKTVFCCQREFEKHRNFPANGVVLTEQEACRRLRDEGYLKFSATQWTHRESISDTPSLHMIADVVESLTDKWANEEREHEKHFILIASFFIVGMVGLAIAIYREFWK